MKNLLFAATLAVGLARLCSASTATIQTKADWDSGIETAIETSTFGSPALMGSLTYTVITNYGLFADCFNDTTTSHKNYVAAGAGNFWTVPGYLGVQPVQGSTFMVLTPTAYFQLTRTPSVTFPLTSYSWAGWFLDTSFTSGLVDFGMYTPASNPYTIRSNGANAANLTYQTPGTENAPTAPSLFPRKTGRWRYFQIREDLGTVLEYSVDGQPMAMVNPAAGANFFYFYSSVPSSPLMPALDYLTLSSYGSSNRSLFLYTPLAGYRVHLQPAITITAGAYCDIYASQGVTISPAPWPEEQPFLTASLYNAAGIYLGSVSTTGKTDAFTGNYLSFQMSYTPTGTWAKTFTFAAPLSAAASVDWVTPNNLPLNTFVTVQAALSTDGTTFGALQTLSGSGLEVPGSQGCLAMQLKVLFSTSDSTQTPLLTSLSVRYPDATMPTSTVPVPQPDIPFVGWCVPNPLVADGASLASIYVKADGTQTLHIYDTGRREVRVLTGTGINGLAALPWDGKDSTGLLLPSGVYLGMVENSGIRIKLALLRAKR